MNIQSVSIHCSLSIKTFSTDSAYIWFLSSVYSLMLSCPKELIVHDLCSIEISFVNEQSVGVYSLLLLY